MVVSSTLNHHHPFYTPGGWRSVSRGRMKALRGGSSAGGGRKGEAHRASPGGMRLPPAEKRTRGKRNLRGRWRERERERAAAPENEERAKGGRARGEGARLRVPQQR